jgi:signal transduction histidine kinase
MAKPDPSGDSGRDYAVTNPLRPIIMAGGLSLAMFATSVAIIYMTLADTGSPQLRPGATYALSFMALWLAAMVVLVVRRPDNRERVRVWGWVAMGITLGSHILCVWLIWGVMPSIPEQAQFVLAIPLIGAAPVQIISSPENTVANRIGIVAVLGSLAVFFAVHGVGQGRLVSLYIAGFGGLMFILSNRIKRTVQATVAARLNSDATARQLESLLAAVAAERDAKTRFIAAASHDLGQPLQAAALFFDQSLRATDAGARARAVDGVRRAFAAAEQLLSHMLNHLRLEADAVEPHPSFIAVQPLLARIAAQYAPAAQSVGIQVRVAGGEQVLLADPVLMNRALGNLLHNAIQHSHGARVLLAVRRHGAGRLRLWVLDDGVGVGRVDARHIFDDYYQGATQRNAVRSGFGLGLSSVRRIAALMGATAGLDPRWRKGSAFYLEFEAQAAAAASGLGARADVTREAAA